MLGRVTEIIRNLPESEELVWSGLPSIPFGLPLGKPAAYYKNYGKVIFRIPKQQRPIMRGEVMAITTGSAPVCEGDGLPLVDEERYSVVGIQDFLRYLEFKKLRKIAECILREYEMELALNDIEEWETEGNSWLPGVTREGKTLMLEVLLGYSYPTQTGVHVVREDVAWEKYKDECHKAGVPINWNAKIPADYKLFIESPVGELGDKQSDPETIEEFLKRIR